MKQCSLEHSFNYYCTPVAVAAQARARLLAGEARPSPSRLPGHRVSPNGSDGFAVLQRPGRAEPPRPVRDLPDETPCAAGPENLRPGRQSSTPARPPDDLRYAARPPEAGPGNAAGLPGPPGRRAFR
jgi:hypothetical protein